MADNDGDDDDDGPEDAEALPTPAELEQIRDPVVRNKVVHMVERYEMFRSPLLPPEVLVDRT